ncbi:hypothetical protein SAY87_013510 [Trapa incisa]|uniref:Uncharacterized protein n=1 Tax=Trapa incisa TaxID=236973 RepID=A0AAN7QD40_9MYRT|nr:hypothetical protein SAY87_013510 [Trapa incisa]
MPLLQGLARLLDLLFNWFKCYFGWQAVEAPKKWLEPMKLAQTQKSWKAGEEPKIASELFGHAYNEINSPYRLPLTKFLNKYAAQSVDYFLARLDQPKYFGRFMYIIWSHAGQHLRDELAKSPLALKLLANAFPEFMSKPEVSGGPGSTSSLMKA